MGIGRVLGFGAWSLGFRNLVDLRLSDRRRPLQEIKITAPVRLSHVLGVEPAEPARVDRGARAPGRSPLCQLLLRHAQRECPAGDVDRLAAQLLLTDLAVIASTTRALNDLAAKRLTGAVADLVAARHDAERSMQEAS